MSKANQLRNASLYLIPVILGNALPIITLPIFTRILSVQEYGIYALAQVYAIFMSGVSNFGLTTGYERNFFESKDIIKRAGLLYSTLVFVIFTFAIFGLITYCFSSKLSSWIIGNPKYADILFWSYCAVGVTGLKTYFLIYFKNMENAKANVWYTIDESLITVALSCFMIIYLRIGVMGLIWGQLIASLLVFFALCFRFFKTLPLKLDFTALKSSLRLSLPLTPRIFFGVISNQFDKYLIGLISTVGGVGVYNIGQKIANITFTFMTAIQNVFGPQVYRRMFDMGAEEGGRSIGKYLTPFLYISIAGALIVSLFAEEAIMILTPKSYHGAVDIVSILTLLFGTYFFGKQPQLVYARKTGITSFLTLLSIILNVGVNIPFIYAFGVIGAAWGTLLVGLITGLISFMLSQKYYRIYWEYQKLASIFLVFFISTIVCILLRSFEETYGIRLLVKASCIIFYFYLGYRYNIVSRENFLLLKNALPGNKSTLRSI